VWGRPILCVWISSSSFWSTSGLLRLDPRRGNGNGSPTVGDGSQGNGSGSHINTIKFMRFTWTSSSPCNNGHLRHQLLCARHFLGLLRDSTSNCSAGSLSCHHAAVGVNAIASRWTATLQWLPLRGEGVAGPFFSSYELVYDVSCLARKRCVVPFGLHFRCNLFGTICNTTQTQPLRQIP